MNAGKLTPSSTTRISIGKYYSSTPEVKLDLETLHTMSFLLSHLPSISLLLLRRCDGLVCARSI